MTSDEKLQQQHRFRKAQGKLTNSEITKMCKQIIRKEGHVSIYEKFNRVNKEELGKVISKLEGTGNYMLDKLPTGSWVLKKSPPKNSLRHDIKMAVVTSLLTLLVGYILWRVDNRSKSQEIQKLKDDMKVLIERTNPQGGQ